MVVCVWPKLWWLTMSTIPQTLSKKLKNGSQEQVLQVADTAFKICQK